MKQLNNFFTSFYERLSVSAGFTSFLSSFLKNKTISLSGISDSSLGLFASACYKKLKRPLLIIIEDAKQAEKTRDDLDFVIGENRVAFLPNADSYDSELSTEYTLNSYYINDALHKLSPNKNPIVVSTIGGLDTKFPNPEYSRLNHHKITVGRDFGWDNLSNILEDFNYNRVDTVFYPMDYSLKGSIIDFFLPGTDNPYRVEFSGDRVDSIRTFDIEEQISILNQDYVELKPPATNHRESNSTHIYSYLKENTIVFVYEAENIFDNYSDKIINNKSLSKYKRIFLNQLAKSDHNFNFTIPSFIKNNTAVFKSHVNTLHEKHRDSEIFIICQNTTQISRLEKLFAGLPVQYCEGYLSHSVEMYEINLFLFAEHDIFSREAPGCRFRKLPRDINVEKFDMDSIELGDIMVHLNYGIGKYLGLIKIRAFNKEKECLTLEYKDGSKVYVPLERMKDVQRYKATEGYVPKLTKLGGSEWDKIKLKTRRSVENITSDIIDLYASRLKAKGFAFKADSDFQVEMESEFTYEETPDQIVATEEIKKDMEKHAPMDRLLCGDVGFGKTEVAIRAAFKAVSNSKQVLVLVPTTILADQHYASFCERLDKYPVTVSILSRFVSRKKQKDTIKGLSEGTVDIVIGTHRLLSEDVKFIKLGLLIIDEEHRFGVKHKEKIKKYRNNVDILSLSATPIPRTLHFSLIGARDFSQINTPPRFRLPIITEAISFKDKSIKQIINREISRKGQIFFVHNEIKSIQTITLKLHSLFPELRISYAHGRMTEKIIEPIMKDFINNKIDILVSTSIIESGIDIPNVNTMIINKAHKFGLAQLYQLRGRVGRGKRRAYCYLLIPKTTKLSKEALKRIKTIKRYTSLGSGYDIAMKDMEIRGTGNVFGVEQSGNIQSIGYDLYIKIIRDSIKEKKIAGSNFEEKPTDQEIDVEINTQEAIFIPETYVSKESIRFSFYSRLSNCRTINEIDIINKELKDRFGNIPVEAANLIKLSEIRILANNLGISKIKFGEKNVGLLIGENNPFDDLNNLFLIMQNISKQLKLSYKFRPGKELQLIIFIKFKYKINIIKQFLYLLGEQVNL